MQVFLIGRLLFEHHLRVGNLSRGRVDISYLKWNRRAKKFENLLAQNIFFIDTEVSGIFALISFYKNFFLNRQKHVTFLNQGANELFSLC